MHGLTVFVHVLHHQRHLLDMLLEQRVELLDLLGIQVQFAVQELGHGPVVTSRPIALRTLQRRTVNMAPPQSTQEDHIQDHEYSPTPEAQAILAEYIHGLFHYSFTVNMSSIFA